MFQSPVIVLLVIGILFAQTAQIFSHSTTDSASNDSSSCIPGGKYGNGGRGVSDMRRFPSLRGAQPLTVSKGLSSSQGIGNNRPNNDVSRNWLSSTSGDLNSRRNKGGLISNNIVNTQKAVPNPSTKRCSNLSSDNSPTNDVSYSHFIKEAAKKPNTNHDQQTSNEKGHHVTNSRPLSSGANDKIGSLTNEIPSKSNGFFIEKMILHDVDESKEHHDDDDDREDFDYRKNRCESSSSSSSSNSIASLPMKTNPSKNTGSFFDKPNFQVPNDSDDDDDSEDYDYHKNRREGSSSSSISNNDTGLPSSTSPSKNNGLSFEKTISHVPSNGNDNHDDDFDDDDDKEDYVHPKYRPGADLPNNGGNKHHDAKTAPLSQSALKTAVKPSNGRTENFAPGKRVGISDEMLLGFLSRVPRSLGGDKSGRNARGMGFPVGLGSRVNSNNDGKNTISHVPNNGNDNHDDDFDDDDDKEDYVHPKYRPGADLPKNAGNKHHDAKTAPLSQSALKTAVKPSNGRTENFAPGKRVGISDEMLLGFLSRVPRSLVGDKNGRNARGMGFPVGLGSRVNSNNDGKNNICLGGNNGSNGGSSRGPTLTASKPTDRLITKAPSKPQQPIRRWSSFFF